MNNVTTDMKTFKRKEYKDNETLLRAIACWIEHTPEYKKETNYWITLRIPHEWEQRIKDDDQV